MNKIKIICMVLLAIGLVACGKISNEEVNESILTIKNKYDKTTNKEQTTSELEENMTIEETIKQDNSIEKVTEEQEESVVEEIIYTKEEIISLIEEHRDDWYWYLKGVYFFEIPDDRGLLDIFDELKPMIASTQSFEYISKIIDAEKVIEDRIAQGGRRNNDYVIEGNQEEINPDETETFAELNVWIKDPEDNLPMGYMSYDEYVALYGEPKKEDIFTNPYEDKDDWRSTFYSDIKLLDITYEDTEVIFTMTDGVDTYEYKVEFDENYRLRGIEQ